MIAWSNKTKRSKLIKELEKYIIRRCTASDAEANSLICLATFIETFSDSEISANDIIAHCIADHLLQVYENTLSQPDSGLWLVINVRNMCLLEYMFPFANRETRINKLVYVEHRRLYVLSQFQSSCIGRMLLAKMMGF